MLDKIFKYKVLRFVFVGGTAFLIDYIINNLIVLFLNITPHVESAVANIFSVTISGIYNFYLSRKWTFKSTDPNSKTQLVKFAILSVVNLIISSLSISFLVYIFEGVFSSIDVFFVQSAAKLIVTIILGVSNYFIYQILIFKN